jgi:site-specific recombinase XerD
LKIDIVAISKMLGHAKLSTTMIYTKVLNESKKTEVAKWNQFLSE